jgi:hypothetical protein
VASAAAVTAASAVTGRWVRRSPCGSPVSPADREPHSRFSWSGRGAFYEACLGGHLLPVSSGMSDYYTMMAKAVGALDPNTGDARLLLYERARAALVAELRGADPALDPSDIMAAQMLLELAIGEVEADAQRDQHSRQTIDAPSMAWPAREGRRRQNAPHQAV